MIQTILHYAFLYVRFSIIVGILFVIITTVEKTFTYGNMKERILIALQIALLWLPFTIYIIFDEGVSFIKKRRK